MEKKDVRCDRIESDEMSKTVKRMAKDRIRGDAKRRQKEERREEETRREERSAKERR